MRALILTCSTGGGHNSCSEAIRQVFHRNNVICDVADSLQFISGKLARFMSWGHSTMYRHFPWLFRWGYSFVERHPHIMQEDTAVYRFLSSGAGRLYVHVCQKNYDTIICTHVFSGILVSQMLKAHPIELKTAFVATDYTCSPGVASSHLDWYFIPHDTLSAEFADKGLPADKIIVSGIPINEKFHCSQQKKSAKEAVGIPASHSHLLMMCGSMGCGPMEKLTKILQSQMQDSMELSIICGTNEKLRRTLLAVTGNHPRIHVHGFVTNMSELMDSADLYLTKPGGLSTTEAAAKQLPMVLIDAVAGCEAPNMDFFISNGGAVTADSIQDLAQQCLFMLTNPDTLQKMASCIAPICNKHAAETIFSVLQRR